MKQRCYYPKTIYFHRWGGRGIRVCDRWRDSFEAFLEDMGPRPGTGYQLDRIDNDGHYEPGNCRWAPRTVQTRNTCRNRWLSLDGETMTVQGWAERTGISSRTIRQRIDYCGWSVERALTTPLTHG